MKINRLSKKILSIILAGAFLLSSASAFLMASAESIDVWSGTIASGFSEGDGSEGSPYLIRNGEELAYAINYSEADKYYRIENDIYLNHPDKFDWMTGEYSGEAPNQWYANIAVQGSFDGNGHTVFGLYYNSNNGNTDYSWWGLGESVGLFPSVAKETKLTINKLGIDNSYLSGSQAVGAFVGAKSENISTYASLEINESYVGENVFLGGYDTGAFLGIARGFSASISDSYSLATQFAKSYSGLVSDKWDGEITMTRCYNGNGALYTKGDTASVTITDCYATEAGTGGGSVLESDAMQGLSAVENMGNLGSKFVTTAGYPALKCFFTELNDEINVEIEPSRYSNEENLELARKAVGEGLVLLKNRDNALPLKSDETVAFFGSGQNSSGFIRSGGGSGDVYLSYNPPGPADVLAELANSNKASIYEPLYEAYLNNSSYVPDDTMYDNASAAADTAIVIISRRSAEAGDISPEEWELTDAEKTMLQTVSEKFKKVVVLLNCVSSFCTNWSIDGNDLGIDVDALLACYVPGEMGGYGIADVLLGDVNPSGKLTDTYAKELNDYPSTETFLESDSYVNYTEDIYVGYRYFETFAKDRVNYPFGFGLSYTDFEIQNQTVKNDGENITVTATVKNTGKVAGKEVVQVYFSAPQKGVNGAVLSKSAIELAGFVKTKLIEPGESEDVTVTFSVSNMASYDDVGYTEFKSAYVLEAGSYKLYIGNSVRNIKEAGTYTVDETRAVEQLSKYGEVTLEERLEATLNSDGSYTMSYADPSISALKENQHYIKSDTVTVIEAEELSESNGSINVFDTFGGNGYISDSYNYHSIADGKAIGEFESGSYFVYDFLVKKDGKYNIGLVAANESQSNEDGLLTVSYSSDGVNWTDIEDFSFNSVSTYANKDAEDKHEFNFAYTRLGEISFSKGDVYLRFNVNCNSKTKLDKLFIIPENTKLDLADIAGYYNVEFVPIVTSDETVWIEAENRANISHGDIKQESFSGFLFNGVTYNNSISGNSIGTFHNATGGYFYYDIIVEEAGNYNLGFVSSDGSYSGKSAHDLFSIAYSTDGGTNWIESDCPNFDSVNTCSVGTSGRWFNFVYSIEDFEGNRYNITLPKGNVRLRFKVADDIDGQAISDVTNCNLDKFSISPASAPATLQDVCELYGVSYTPVINSATAVWYEAETYDAVSGGVQAQAFSSTQGYIADGSGNYTQIDAGQVIGYLDQSTTGYVEYTLNSANAGTYGIGFTVASGHPDLLSLYNGKAPGVLTVQISTDGGSTWTDQFTMDVNYTGPEVAGVTQRWWNFQYSNTGFNGNEYQIEIPKGAFKLRIACNENSVTYYGANIDKFVIYPLDNKVNLKTALNYYFGSEDVSTDTTNNEQIDVDLTQDYYTGITYSDVLNGTNTLDELVAQMSYNELIELTYSKNMDWSWGYTGYIGFINDETAEKYGIYSADTADGPQGLRLKYYNSTCWPSIILQASTWNTDLIYEIGVAAAEECLTDNIDIWLTPGMNIHRNPLCGRNFEYYSEDPLLTGTMASALVKGVQSKGVSVSVKHFALNNKERNRKYSDSRVSEKALREIYLKGFRMVVEEANPICFMSSYNKINGEWASANESLLKHILREEWGFEGLIMSDWTSIPTFTPEINSGNNVKTGDGFDPDELRQAVKLQLVTRDTLEENAKYVIKALASMPDMAINPYKVTKLSEQGTATVRTTEYSHKSHFARLSMVGNELYVPGGNGYFYEYSFEADKACKYAVSMSYLSSAAVDSAISVYVNGELIEEGISLAQAGALTEIELCTAELTAGINTVRLVQTAESTAANYYSVSLVSEDYAKVNEVNNLIDTLIVNDNEQELQEIMEKYNAISEAFRANVGNDRLRKLNEAFEVIASDDKGIAVIDKSDNGYKVNLTLNPANDSAPNGTVKTINGEIGFVGSEYVSKQNGEKTGTVFESGKPFTVSTYINPANTSSDSKVIIDNGVVSLKLYNSEINFSIKQSNGEESTVSYYLNSKQYGLWHLVTAVYDGENIKLSVDGSDFFSKTVDAFEESQSDISVGDEGSEIYIKYLHIFNGAYTQPDTVSVTDENVELWFDFNDFYYIAVSKKGDVNANGTTDLLDLVRLKKMSCRAVSPNWRADVDGNALPATAQDLVTLVKILLKG